MAASLGSPFLGAATGTIASLPTTHLHPHPSKVTRLGALLLAALLSNSLAFPGPAVLIPEFSFALLLITVLAAYIALYSTV